MKPPVVKSYVSHAQRRPERQPRRVRLARRSRSAQPTLNEGRSVNPGDTHSLVGDRVNEGPSVQSADQRSTKAGASTPATRAARRPQRAAESGQIAQRRPERQPRRHHGPRLHLLGHNAQRRPERQPRHTPKAAAESCSAQRRPERQPRRHENTPVGRSSALERRPFRFESGTPRALNEGRSVNPGDTAKSCKRVVSGPTIARPRAREPRRRRVCGHFTRFRTIPRQNGQDQAVETALTAAEHMRFPRITEGSQMSQSTQGWPSS